MAVEHGRRAVLTAAGKDLLMVLGMQANRLLGLRYAREAEALARNAIRETSFRYGMLPLMLTLARAS